MIRWCSFCQHYLEEVAPFEDYSMTHGICRDCYARKNEVTSPKNLEKIEPIAELHRRLAAAGSSGDLNEARSALKQAMLMNLRPLDFLLGILQPCLYQIGEKWEKGEISVCEEHRFTSLAASIVQVAADLVPDTEHCRQALSPRVIAVNAEDNAHFLGLRMLELFLILNKVKTFAVFERVSRRVLRELVASRKPQFVVFSVALPDQLNDVQETVGELGKEHPGLKFAIGGYPLRRAPLKALPGIQVCRSLSEFIESLRDTTPA